MLTGAYITMVLLPINYPLNLTGQKQAMFNYSQYQGSKIDNPAARTDLMMRLHEAMGGSIDQGNLAIDRLSTFIAEKRATSGGNASNPHPDARRAVPMVDVRRLGVQAIPNRIEELAMDVFNLHTRKRVGTFEARRIAFSVK